ncbi:MAG: transporter [Thermodesulfobacteriota bacterium]
MRKAIAIVALALLWAGIPCTPASAFNQPPLNLGLTDILDGALPGPGTYFTEYIQAYRGRTFRGTNGGEIAGGPRMANVLAMNQFVHVYNHKVLGAHVGVDVLLPVVGIGASGTLGAAGPDVTANPAPIGDLVAGPFLQWFDTKLLGRPFLQRVELDITFPTGQYDSRYLINPGSNIWTIEPYYAFTWFITPTFSTSWRIHYTWNSENENPFAALGADDVQAGRAFHFNYSFECEVRKNFRAALAGYYLKQLNEDKVNGISAGGSKEEVFAFGPAAHWIVSPNFSMGLKTAIETGVENRPKGNRTTLRMTYKF